jgi:hypothetical protein
MRIAARSPAERRALLWCLGVGLLAVALAVSLHGRRPLFEVVWGLGSRQFSIAAKILGLDAVLVLAGGRGPRAIATVALAILGICLVLVACCGLLIPFVSVALLLHVESLGWSPLIQGLLVFGCIGTMSVVQWLSLKAVAENDRLHG